MSVRKQRWVTRKGEPREAWLVDYKDGEGERRAKFFKKKKDADAYHSSVRVEVAAGTHTPPSRSITLKQAAEDWLNSSRARVWSVPRWRTTSSRCATTSSRVWARSSSPC